MPSSFWGFIHGNFRRNSRNPCKNIQEFLGNILSIIMFISNIIINDVNYNINIRLSNIVVGNIISNNSDINYNRCTII